MATETVSPDQRTERRSIALACSIDVALIARTLRRLVNANDREDDVDHVAIDAMCARIEDLSNASAEMLDPPSVGARTIQQVREDLGWNKSEVSHG